VGDRIIAITDRHGGFVLRSSVNAGEESPGGGSFYLRIPARRLRAAMRDLSEIASVRARSQSGRDVTRRFVSVADDLRAAVAERRGLLRRLERADTDRAAEAIQTRLRLVAGRINLLRGRLQALRERTSYAAVTVTLERKEKKGGQLPGGTADAFDDALGSLVGTLNFAIRTVGVLIPLGLATAAAWLAAGTVRRRRREAVLS
jgi:hypothetical protein